MALLVAKGLGRAYGRHVPVRDVDLELSAGEVLGLVGPNGGGKSTLLLLLAGLTRPSSGSVALDGVSCEEVAQRATGSIGLITAEPGLYPLLSGRENLAFFGGLYGLGAAEVGRRAQALLADLDVDDDLDRPSAAYSSGMRQKVSLARALLLAPRLLLLDEPTSNLDPMSSTIIHRAVRARADAGVAVVLATHDLHAAEHVCDRVAVMQGTVRRIERLDGARSAPPPGRLHALYREVVR